MNLINEKAKHIKFGTGVIQSNENGVIRIQFDEEFGEKAFIYPVAFEQFLKLNNPVLEERVQNELKQIASEKERQRREAERLKEEERREVERLKEEERRAKQEQSKLKSKAAKKAKKEKVL